MTFIIGVIPAKKTSRRFPRKNFMTFQHTTLLAHATRKLREVCDLVVISTDDVEAVREALRDCQDVPARPLEIRERSPDLAQDDTPTEAVVLDVLAHLNIADGWVVVSQVTSPLWTPEQLRTALKELNQIESRYGDWNHLVSVNPAYQPNGCFYVTTIQTLKHTGTLFGPRTMLFPMGWSDSIDIDYPYQLDIAESVLREMGRMI
jgi:CMP-N-acetylneuraminic acid synthetase